MTQNEESQKAKPKSNPDYTDTAVNLCNPPEIKLVLEQYHALQAKGEELMEEIRKLSPELSLRYDFILASLDEMKENMKPLIKEHGSYQDTEAGEYALIYKAKTPEYHVLPFKEGWPDYVAAVVTEAINPDVLKGLIKGGLFSMATLEAEGVITFKEKFVTVIK